MNQKKVTRVVLDAMLSLMIVFEMLIQFTGEFLHEVVGFAFFMTIIVHVVLSAKWVKATARNAKAGKLTARRTALVVVGSLLAVETIVLGVSSVAISGILSSTGFVWPIGTYSQWALVHMLSSYALCATVVVHLAMHWAFLASAFKVPYDPSRRRAISAGVNVMTAAGVLALGVTAAGKMAPQLGGAGQGAFAYDGANGADANSGTDAGDAGGMDGAGGAAAHGVEDGASESAGGAASGSAPSGNFGKSRKKGRSVYSSDSATGSNSGQVPSGSASGSAPGASSGDSESRPLSGGGSSTSNDAGTGASGICTLCRKQCPLSAPKCNKPYEAGLL